MGRGQERTEQSGIITPEYKQYMQAIRSERNPTKLKAHSQNLITEVTNGNVDLFSLTDACAFAVDIMSDSERLQQTGVQILHGLESYIGSTGVLIRRVFPDNSPVTGTMAGELARNIGQANAWLSVHTSGGIAFDGLLNMLSVASSALGRNRLHVVTLTLSKRAQLQKNTPEYKKVIQNRIMLTDLFGRINPGMQDQELFQAKDTILQHIIETSADTVEGVPDLYTAEFNNISLKGIVEETDDDKFREKVLDFITYAPKGDLIWQNLTDALFIVPLKIYNIDSSSIKFFDFYRRVFHFQSWLSHALVLPALDKGERDFRRDRKIAEALKGYPDITLQRLGQTVDYTITNSGELYRVFVEPINLEEIFARFPIIKHAYNEARDISLIEFADLTTASFLQYNARDITDSLKKRFQNIKAIQAVIAGFQTTVFGISPKDRHTTAVLSLLDNVAPRETWSKAINDIQDPHDLRVAMSGSLDKKGEDPSILSIKENSFLAGLGFSSITVENDFILQSGLRITIPIVHPYGRINIFARVHQDGKQECISVGNTPEMPNLSSFFEALVEASFYKYRGADLVTIPLISTSQENETAEALGRDTSTKKNAITDQDEVASMLAELRRKLIEISGEK